VRPDLLTAPAPPSAFTQGKSLSGQCITSPAGNLSLEPVPGWSPAARAMLIELPCSRGLLDLTLLFIAEPGLEVSVLASIGTSGARARRQGR
jgi:hypothetical protein